MKRILLAIALPVALFSCTKEEENVNPGFRQPTCADTTDDGKFEVFSKPEEAKFLQWFKIIPDEEVPGVVASQELSSHILYNNSAVFDPYLRYELDQPARLFAYLVLNGNNEYYSWVQDGDTSQPNELNIYNARHLQLTPGCYRLYYVFAGSDSGTVFTKGHYDLEVKQ